MAAILRKETFIIPEKAEIAKHGYLWKRGKLNKNWKRRWCVFYENNTISYYEHPENTEETPLGEISLYNVSELKQDKTNKDNKEENIFHLITTKRTFILKCENNSEFNEWIKIIEIRLNPIIIYKGWANKRGEIHHSWKKRYFLLIKYKNNEQKIELRYYENDTLTKFKGVIECNLIYKIDAISKYQSIKKYGNGKDKTLELLTLKRTYVLNFNDENNRNLWQQILIKSLTTKNKNNESVQELQEEKEEFSDK